MRRLLLLFLLVPAALVFGGACGDGDRDGDDGISVVATTSQIGALTREVAGGRVDLQVLIPPGVEAHDYEPSSGQVRALQDADLILRNGLGLDDFLDDVVEGAARGNIVTATEGVDARPGASGKGGLDPHVWHDIDNAKQMTFAIAEALAEVDPENASDYDANARAYAETLDETDREIRELFAPIPAARRKVVTNHDAFGYFIRRYELEFVGAIFTSSGSSAQPSAGDLARLADLIQEEGVQAILVERELDAGTARQLARDTGVAIVEGLYADSLGDPGSEEGTVHGMLLWNARRIAEGLSR